MEQDKSILMRCLFSVSRKRQLMILRQLENYGPLIHLEELSFQRSKNFEILLKVR